MIQKKKRKGQSTLEYILLVTAVIAVFVIFLKPGGSVGKHLGNTLNEVFLGGRSLANQIGNK
ncbi:MAG: class III signal peptide-containing protein [Candidatus Omnitrophota bacterium]